MAVVVVDIAVRVVVHVLVQRAHREVVRQVLLHLAGEGPLVFLAIVVREGVFDARRFDVGEARPVLEVATLVAAARLDAEVEGKLDREGRREQVTEMLPLLAFGVVVAEAIAAAEFDLLEQPSRPSGTGTR